MSSSNSQSDTSTSLSSSGNQSNTTSGSQSQSTSTSGQSQQSSSSSGSTPSVGSQSTTVPIDDDTDYQENIEDAEPNQPLEWGILSALNTSLFDTFKFIERNEDESTTFKFGRVHHECHYVFNKDDFKALGEGNFFSNISKLHFSIYKETDDRVACGFTVFIKDNSTNGTYVNGILVGKGNVQPLDNYSTISIAQADREAFIFVNKKQQQIELASLPPDFIQKYVLEDLRLGSGATGVVHRGLQRNSNRYVAVKIIKKNQNLNVSSDIRYEAILMQNFTHTNIVQVEDVFENDDTVYIVLEYIAGGELFDMVKNKGAITEVHCKRMFKQLLQAVEYLHSKSIVHRDIKPENVLLTSQDPGTCTIKVTDFGLSRVVAEQSLLQTLVGTSLYIAPEIVQGKGYTRAADLWSLGCVLFIMLSGRPPFSKTNVEGQLNRAIMQSAYTLNNEAWTNVSTTAKELVKRFLTVDVKKRITLAEALEHEWFNNELSKSKRKYEEEDNNDLKSRKKKE